MSGGRDVWERWDEVDPLLTRLLDTPAADRPRQLALCPDVELRNLLETLLAASEDERLDAGAIASLRVAAVDGLTAGSQYIGPYRVLELIGRGGTGRVYRAERDDPAFPQRVAIKVLKRGLDSADAVARFVAERQILAGLRHPAIVAAFDAGTTDDGRPYLVMEEVRGRTITRHCAAQQLDERARLVLFASAVRAVCHAHENGVVHGDIKPSNVLVTHDEQQVRLLDFGIATLLAPPAGADAAPPGSVLPSEPGAASPFAVDTAPPPAAVRMLTPGYASPEQLLGLAVTERSDVYQLGVLLHELLTGRRPDAGAPPFAAGAGDPSADLERIMRRALQHEPLDRYASARGLHDAIRAYLHRATDTTAGAVPARDRTVTLRVRRRSRVGAAAAVTVVAAAALLLAVALRPAAADVHWFAFAGIEDETADADAAVSQEVTKLLATILGSTPGMQFVDLEAEGTAPVSVAALLPAARHAGLSQLLHGVIRRPARDRLELVLRRTSVADDVVIDSVMVRGSDAFELVDRATAALLARLRLPPSGMTAAGVTTVDPRAYLLYVEGLTAFGAGDERVALRFFRAALAQDSGFAMAAYYAFRASYGFDHDGSLELLNRAYRLSDRAADRERLVIRALWADHVHDLGAPVLADSLVARYPAEPVGHYLRGRYLNVTGDFLAAVPHLQRAIRLDSLSLHAERVMCTACDALAALRNAYDNADSLAAGLRTAQRWTTLQPRAAAAWHALATNLLIGGQHDAAIAARAHAAALRVGNERDPLFAGVASIHRGDFDDADAVFRLHAQTGTPGVRREALWWLAISLRYQGRLREALGTAVQFGQMFERTDGDPFQDVAERALHAQVLYEMGRYDEAAALFAGGVGEYDRHTPSRQARSDTWMMTHAATALVAAGDLAAASDLAETMKSTGALSLYGRDRRLHHYVRGIVARARGADEAEVEEHLRAALYSTSVGYSRIGLELAGSLLRQGRPTEAAALLGAALRGSIQANGFYATRPDLHELLGRAWEDAGRADSASVHYRAALSAWQGADESFAPRLVALRRGLERVGSPGAPRM